MLQHFQKVKNNRTAPERARHDAFYVVSRWTCQRALQCHFASQLQRKKSKVYWRTDPMDRRMHGFQKSMRNLSISWSSVLRTNGLKNDSDNDISTKLMKLENVKTKIQRHAGLRDANQPENLPNAIEKSERHQKTYEKRQKKTAQNGNKTGEKRQKNSETK